MRSYYPITKNNKLIALIDSEKIIKTSTLPEKGYIWSYNSSFKDSNIVFAKLFSQGKNIDKDCPEHLKEMWEKVKGAYQKHTNIFKKLGMDAETDYLLDSVPERVLVDYYGTGNLIIEHTLSNIKTCKNYDFYIELSDMLNEIGKQKINLDSKKVSSYSRVSKRRSINYKLFGTKTGRLATTKESFEIHNIDKRFRDVLKPRNDYFLELDFNGAEFRTIIAILGLEQPSSDLYEFHRKLMKSDAKRQEIKLESIKWVYGRDTYNEGLSSFYDIEYLYNNFWDGYQIKTPFGRTIVADKDHAINYLVQSTGSDIFLRQCLKLREFLQNRKSKIAFMIHDSVTIDLAKEDIPLIKELAKVFSSTQFGTFLPSIEIGKDFGNLRKVNV